MTRSEIVRLVLTLPADEQVAIARELALNLAENGADLPDMPAAEWDRAWGAEAERRLREIEEGKVETIPWHEVMAEVRAVLRSRPTRSRITADSKVMGGRPCIRGLRVTVSMVVGLLAEGKTTAEILALYPVLEEDDVREALSYAAWRAGGRETSRYPHIGRFERRVPE